MIEFAIVLFIKRQADRKKTRSLRRSSRDARLCSMNVKTLQTMEIESLKRKTITEMDTYTFTDKVDFAAFSFFNISFFMFNCIYFIIFAFWISWWIQFAFCVKKFFKYFSNWYTFAYSIAHSYKVGPIRNIILKTNKTRLSSTIWTTRLSKDEYVVIHQFNTRNFDVFYVCMENFSIQLYGIFKSILCEW